MPVLGFFHILNWLINTVLMVNTFARVKAFGNIYLAVKLSLFQIIFSFVAEWTLCKNVLKYEVLIKRGWLVLELGVIYLDGVFRFSPDIEFEGVFRKHMFEFVEARTTWILPINTKRLSLFQTLRIKAHFSSQLVSWAIVGCFHLAQMYTINHANWWNNGKHFTNVTLKVTFFDHFHWC